MTVRVLGLKSGTTPEDHRLGLSTFMNPYGGVLDRKSGLAYYPGSANLSTVSAMQASISPFVAWVDGGSAPLQAGYPVVSDADVAITFDNGEPSVVRVDRVIVRVRDNPYDSSGVQTAAVEYLKGQTSGSATSVPPGALLLWEVNVPAGASTGSGGISFSSARVDKRIYTSGLGGVLPVPGVTERNALTPHDHMMIWRMDNRTLEIYNAGALSWQPYTSALPTATVTAYSVTSFLGNWSGTFQIFVSSSGVATVRAELTNSGGSVSSSNISSSLPVGCPWPANNTRLFGSAADNSGGNFRFARMDIITGLISMSCPASMLAGQTLSIGGTYLF